MNSLADTRVVDMVVERPEAAEILARFGIVFCPGCYVALTSTLEQAGHYNAVGDIPRFLREVADFLEQHPAP